MVDLNSIFERIKRTGVSSEGLDYCERVLFGVPSRSVEDSKGKNVVGKYASLKTGESIDFESRGPELGYLLAAEYDPSIIWVGAQPPLVWLYAHDRRGRRRPTKYTPDFLEVRPDRVDVIEVKPEDKLEQLITEFPDDWRKDHDCVYRRLSAEDVFRRMGLGFRVWNAGLQSSVHRTNLRYLIRVKQRLGPPGDDLLGTLKAHFANNAWDTLDGVKKSANLASTDPILLCIGYGALRADLEHSLVFEPEAIVSPSLKVLQSIVASANTSLQEGVAFSEVPTMKMAEAGCSRLDRWQQGPKDRQWHRLNAAVKKGQAKGLSPFLALVPNYSNRGNYTERLSPAQTERLIAGIDAFWHSGQSSTLIRAHSNYLLDLAKKGQEHLRTSYTTFRRYAYSEKQRARLKNRGGRRAANRGEAISDPRTRELRPVRPFEKASFDSTPLDILLIMAICPSLTLVRRPVLTALIDDATDSELGYWLSFRAPSQASVAMALRSCISTHGRLPEIIHGDRGSEFRSTFLKHLCAYHGVTLQYSPPAYPRSNAAAESFFGQQQVTFINDLPGTLIDHDRRGTDSAKSPKEMAALDMPQFSALYRTFHTSHADQIATGTAETRNSSFLRKLAQWPSSGIPLSLDIKTLISTCPEKQKGDWRIDRTHGIKINELTYYSEILQTPRLRKYNLRVRPDPSNPFLIYIGFEGKWHIGLHGCAALYDASTFTSRLNYSLGHLNREGRKTYNRMLQAIVSKEAFERCRDRSFDEHTRSDEAELSVASDRYALEKRFERLAIADASAAEVIFE